MRDGKRAQLNYLKTHQRIAQASRNGWSDLIREIEEGARNDLVEVKWLAKYDQLGHDFVLRVKVKVRSPDDLLLQIWFKDQHPGNSTPEQQPWIASVVDFTVEQKVKEAQIGLIDAQWSEENADKTFTAQLWGYLEHEGEIESFTFKKEFTYPG